MQTTEYKKPRKSFKNMDFLQEWFDKLGDTAYNKYNGSEWGKDRAAALSMYAKCRKTGIYDSINS